MTTCLPFPARPQPAAAGADDERLQEKFNRRIKTQTVLPSAETAAMLFWTLMKSGQITICKVDGWQTLGEMVAGPAPVDLAV